MIIIDWSALAGKQKKQHDQIEAKLAKGKLNVNKSNNNEQQEKEQEKKHICCEKQCKQVSSSNSSKNEWT